MGVSYPTTGTQNGNPGSTAMQTKTLGRGVLLGLLAFGGAQGAELSLSGGPAVFCPGAIGSAFVGVSNSSSVPQRIPNGTTLTLAFSIPLAGRLAIGGTANSTTLPSQSSFSGNTATITFPDGAVMPGD